MTFYFSGRLNVSKLISKKLMRQLIEDVGEKNVDRIIEHLNLVVPCREIEQFVGQESVDMQYEQFFASSESTISLLPFSPMKIPTIYALGLIAILFFAVLSSFTVICCMCCCKKKNSTAMAATETTAETEAAAPTATATTASQTAEAEEEKTATANAEVNGENIV
jgi:hypothetical protein